MILLPYHVSAGKNQLFIQEYNIRLQNERGKIEYYKIYRFTAIWRR